METKVIFIDCLGDMRLSQSSPAFYATSKKFTCSVSLTHPVNALGNFLTFRKTFARAFFQRGHTKYGLERWVVN